jgi:hypothetical protein
VEGADILATIAQIAVTLAGFSGIVVVLGERSAHLTPIQTFRVAILIALSLGAMALALIPFGLNLAGLEGAALWRPASALLGAFSALLVAVFFPPTRRFWREFPEIFNPAIIALLVTGHAVNLAVQAATALGAFGNQRVGLYVFGLLWLLMHGAYQFVRILFIPLKSS